MSSFLSSFLSSFKELKLLKFFFVFLLSCSYKDKLYILDMVPCSYLAFTRRARPWRANIKNAFSLPTKSVFSRISIYSILISLPKCILLYPISANILSNEFNRDLHAKGINFFSVISL